MHTQRISIIIVTFNSEKYIWRCIDSIEQQKIPNFMVQIHVIDNNSKDSTIHLVQSFQNKYKNIKITKNRKNIGFAKAVNIGIKKAQDSSFYLLINPDTVSGNTSLEELIKCANTKKAGIVGGSTYNTRGKENGSYFRLPNIQVGIFDFTNFRKLSHNDFWHKYFYYKDLKTTKKTCFPVDVVTGGFMLISRDTVNNIGYFDEKYFMYLEDVDYCFRAKKSGIRIFHSNKSKIIHLGGRSSTNKYRINHTAWLTSRKYYFKKNFNLMTNVIIQPIFMLDDIFILTKMCVSK